MTEDYIPDRVRDLYSLGWRSNKDFESLKEYLKPFVERSYIPALIELARVAMAEGNQSESEALVTRAQGVLADDDFDNSVEIWGAYRQGLGEGNQAEKDSKALALILRLAERGNVAAQEVVMMDYLLGTNGVARNAAEFERWAMLAASNGSQAAAAELRAFRTSVSR